MDREQAMHRLDDLLEEELVALEARDVDEVARLSSRRGSLLITLEATPGAVDEALARSVARRARRNELVASTQLAELRVALAHLDRKDRTMGAYRSGGLTSRPTLLDEEG